VSEHGIETEVKFRVADLAALRAGLIARSAVVTQQRHLERNTLFDDAAHSLQQRGMLLRLRDALDTVLTLKAPAPPQAQNTQHKIRIEVETTVGDYDAAFAILTALGYAPSWRYEKYRESFRLDDAAIALDHTPIGDFVEIEGAPDAIRPLAERLGFDWEDRNLQTYRELFLEAGPVDRIDMVFAPDSA
jgi:adenylate cyclase class 2